MSVFERIKCWRVRRRQALLDQYATLSAEERAKSTSCATSTVRAAVWASELRRSPTAKWSGLTA